MRNEARQSRTFVTFLCCVLAMPTCTYLLPGITAADPVQAVAAGTLLGVAYLVIRPVMRILTLPIGCLTLGLFNTAIDVALIWGCGQLIEGFQVEGILAAFLGALLVNSVCAIAGGFR